MPQRQPRTHSHLRSTTLEPPQQLKTPLSRPPLRPEFVLQATLTDHGAYSGGHMVATGRRSRDGDTKMVCNLRGDIAANGGEEEGERVLRG